MSRKTKAPRPRSGKKERGKKPSYPSLANGPTPEKRLAAFLRETDSEAVKRMSEAELERRIGEFREIWPNEPEIDDFIAWLHKARRKGR